MFRVAIVGCGAIATKKFIPILQRLRNRAAIVGLCDLDAEALKNVASRFAVPNAFTELDEMMAKQHPDLVIICTPPGTHAGLAIEALEMGAHVLVEKPMALSSEDCDRMIEVSLRHDKKLGVMHNQLFNPAVENARHIVSSDKFGQFLGMRIFLATPVDVMTSRQNHWAHRLPGGVVGETGPHAIYLSLAFLKDVRDVRVRYKKLTPEYPWSVGEDIRFDLIADNGMSSVTLMYGSTQTAAQVDIMGTESLLSLDLQSKTLVKHIRPNLRANTVGKSVLNTVYQTVKALTLNGASYIFSRNWDPHYHGITKFLDYLSDHADYPATGEEGKQVVSLMEVIVQRMRESVPI
jgi:predicted dehydrogenase